LLDLFLGLNNFPHELLLYKLFRNVRFPNYFIPNINVESFPGRFTSESYPVTFSDCGGNEMLTNFKMSSGTSPRASGSVCDLLEFCSHTTSNDKISSVNFTLEVTTLTVG